MKLAGDLSKFYPTSTEFAQALSAHMSVGKICQPNELDSCFAEDIKESEFSIKYYTSELNDSDALQLGFESDFVGINFGDGAAALLAYNPECAITNIYDSNADITQCFVMFYDVNGLASPNTLGADMATINLDDDEDDDMKFTLISPAEITPVNKTECTKMYTDGTILHLCEQDQDYWAGAVKACLKKGKHLATPEELAKLASQLYGQEIPTTGSSYDLTVKDRELGLKLGITTSGGNKTFFSSETAGAYNRCTTRVFQNYCSYTRGEHKRSDNTTYAICF